jgi:predicted P-loop ATPase
VHQYRALPKPPPEPDEEDWQQTLQHASPGAFATNGTGPPPLDWDEILLLSKGGERVESFGNMVLALQHLPFRHSGSTHPHATWAEHCWYDEVRDIRMVGDAPLDDPLTMQAKLQIEQVCRIPMRSRHLVPAALTYLCHQKPRDLLCEWFLGLPKWDKVVRLPFWLHDCANAPRTEYGMDVSRLLIVSLVARALNPGCQYRYVVILEGPEDAGKSRIVEELAGPEWYREISHGLEGKESHMRVRRAWVAELAELATFSRTEEARLKSFFTLKEDTYIPKFANFEVQHKRRTVLIGTYNPEGACDYMRSQTGNTRYLPIPVKDIQINDFLAIRTQLFAEALHYYEMNPDTWWQLSSVGATEAVAEREERRQTSAYEGDLDTWLERTKADVVWWERLAVEYLELPRDKWSDRRTQMEVAKALFALGWRKGKRERMDGVGLIVPWRKG